MCRLQGLSAADRIRLGCGPRDKVRFGYIAISLRRTPPYDRRSSRPGGGDAMGESSMEADRALNLLDDMLWQCLLVAAPVLIATLVVGVVISVFQVATQIQEATLSYVPKILIAAGLMIVLGPWMMTRVTDFARGLYLAIPSLVQ